MKKKIAVLIPAKNEQKNIKKVILLFKKFGKVFVVDDNSNDNTPIISKKFAHKLIKSNRNLGYDGAIRFGISNIIKNNSDLDYLLTVDADGEHSNRYVKQFIKKMNKYDIVIGSRNKLNRFSEYLVSSISKIIYSVSDPLSGMKCYNYRVLKQKFHKIKNDKFDYTGMFFLQIFNKKKISNIKIKVNVQNKSSSFGRGFYSNYKIIKSFLIILFK